MREFIRHPSSIPLEFDVAEQSVQRNEYLTNVSVGGLCFHARSQVPLGSVISIRIPLVEPGFLAQAHVVWCRKSGHGYDIGVQFVDDEHAFHTRMVEQICHIEEYRKQVERREQRRLTSEQAAMEWIEKFSAEFPPLGGGH